MCFCFGALTSAFLVYRSMAERGVQQWAWVTQQTSFIALAIAMALGLSGYLSFVDKTQGNILNNFPQDHLAANVARGLLALTMVRDKRPSGNDAPEILIAPRDEPTFTTSPSPSRSPPCTAPC